MRATLPSNDQISPDTPLRLSVAAALAFPDGSMTASGLRREGARGKLAIERIAGKDFTTLANIERMRELCRVEVRVRDCGPAARRKNGRLVASAVWIIVDGDRHFATGCLKDQAGEAEQRLAAYIADKYRPSRHARDIDQIDLADVLAVYLEDCGPRMGDQPKLERAIGRPQRLLGGKMLSMVTAAECRAYARSRGKTGVPAPTLRPSAPRSTSRQGDRTTAPYG